MIFFETDDYIVINKKPGIPVQTADESQMSVENYIKKYFYSDIHLVNRIDQPISGLCLIAKNEEAKAYFAKAQHEKKIKKKYILVVEEHFVPPKDKRVELQLNKNEKLGKAFVSEEKKEGYKRGIIKFKNHHLLDNYTILDLELKTGRFHQIRAMLSHLGHPIKGDVKYGARRKNKDRSIMLHSWKLSFIPPNLKEEINIVAPFDLDNPLWKLVDKVVKDWN
jgi:23S rRNA pseudouridine1911/1915/1917 synthase